MQQRRKFSSSQKQLFPEKLRKLRWCFSSALQWSGGGDEGRSVVCLGVVRRVNLARYHANIRSKEADALVQKWVRIFHDLWRKQTLTGEEKHIAVSCERERKGKKTAHQQWQMLHCENAADVPVKASIFYKLFIIFECIFERTKFRQGKSGWKV